ncbi:hypothetical protein DITRI_Ditri06bG0015600 [Diplodiscus trichospermus]
MVNFLCFFFFLSIFPYADSLSFQIFRFDPTVKSIAYQESVLLWDAKTGKHSDFNTRFSFEINTLDAPIYGHGLCFFLAPVGYQFPPNSAGGHLGLFNSKTRYSSSNQIVLIEFDSFENPEWDPRGIGGHVGININTIASVVYAQWNASFHSKDTANVSITYDSTAKNLTVSRSYFTTHNPLEKSSISFQLDQVDLMNVLPERVMIGFSAATGVEVERHT